MIRYSSSPRERFPASETGNCIKTLLCEGGGTGRRARLRCVWFILGGSNPLPRTKNREYIVLSVFLLCEEGDLNRAALRSRVSNQPSGLLLSPRVLDP